MSVFQFHFPSSGVETYLFIPPLVAFIISFFTSMAGISGAFLLLPFQMSVLGFTSPSVTSTNFLFNVTGTPGGVYRYARECRFVWPVAILIVIGIIPGVLVGYYLRLTHLPDPKAFKFFVGCVLLLIALKLLKEALPDQWGSGSTGLVAGTAVRGRGTDGDVPGCQGSKIRTGTLDQADAGRCDYYRGIKIVASVFKRLDGLSPTLFQSEIR